MSGKSSDELDTSSIYTISDYLGIKKVSVQELRKCSGYENISDEEAEMIIESLYQLSLTAIKIYNDERNKSV